jgi:hypothetical protein
MRILSVRTGGNRRDCHHTAIYTPCIGGQADVGKRKNGGGKAKKIKNSVKKGNSRVKERAEEEKKRLHRR